MKGVPAIMKKVRATKKGSGSMKGVPAITRSIGFHEGGIGYHEWGIGYHEGGTKRCINNILNNWL